VGKISVPVGRRWRSNGEEDHSEGCSGAVKDAPEPSYNAVPPRCMFGYIQSIDRDDVIKLIMSLPDKQCTSNLMPTWLLKTCASDLAPFLCQLLNASQLSGIFPSSFKSVYVTPILKKPGLAEDDAQN